MFTAEKFCITSGCGVDKFEIASFDKALVVAGLGDYNLVRVSSVIPSSVEKVAKVFYPKGSVLFTAYSSKVTRLDEQIASAVVAAIPKEPRLAGVIMEYSCLGNREQAISVARRLAIEALQRRKINQFHLEEIGIDARGTVGKVTTTFAAIALM